ncbi:hypothetical protein AYO22_09908 [Fonsecaea multimorphosa]|nr:hypothetical protein AYO22_09908 [Fonsecaea multimorphosa]
MALAGTCEVCGNLGACHTEVSAAALVQSAASGCPACSILKDGVFNLVEDFEQIDKLQLVVDLSLFVYLLGKQRERLGVLEFYTLPEVGACDEDIKLYVNGSEKRAEYAALSHRWGGGQPIVLTKSTLEEKQERLVLDDSSKTFKEAVDVTRRLGIPYLWIDSLCILQDDHSDWEKESPLMGSVYNSATITLSAASSINTAGGLFPRGEDRLSRNKTLKLACAGPSGNQEFVHVRARHKDPFNIHETVHSSQEPEQPCLRSRGWVLQEDHLSPRMLHFRKEELAWTCSTYSRCECRTRPSLPLPHPFRAAPGTREKTPELTYTLGIQWPPMVMDYSRRDLTKASDRVAALSGLANYMEDQTSDTYYCGLWYEDLRFQLLWYVDRSGCTGPVPSRFQFPYAPTWSWMSVPAPISYYERYPVGSAPSHRAIRSADAVAPLLTIINVGRLPVDWDNLVGPLLVCPLLVVARVLPVHFDNVTKWWIAEHPVTDFDPENLRVSIDVGEDRPERSPEASYVFILAGRWVGQGMTIACMEAVCILARRMPEQAEPIIDLARRFQRRFGDDVETTGSDSNDAEGPIMPEMDNSYERVGLVRGAGSLQAWTQANVPVEAVFLF